MLVVSISFKSIKKGLLLFRYTITYEKKDNFNIA